MRSRPAEARVHHRKRIPRSNYQPCPHHRTSEAGTQPKLRLHIADALLCQFHQGDQSRPDYATAINELWISRDPVALDALSAELIASLRRSLNLPVRRSPDAILRYAAKMYLGSDRREDWDLKTIKLEDRAPE